MKKRNRTSKRRPQKKSHHLKKKSYKNKKFRGGYNASQMRELQGHGMNMQQIDTLQSMNIPHQDIINRIQIAANNNIDAEDIPEEIVRQIMDERIFNNQTSHFPNIEHDTDEVHYLDMSNLNLTDRTPEVLNLSDLNDNTTLTGYTTSPENSFDFTNSNIFSTPNNSQDDVSLDFSTSDGSLYSLGGYRRKKSVNHKKIKKQRHTKKQKGGKCYGNGVGSNNNSPNWSIYNTNLSTLFPYKP